MRLPLPPLPPLARAALLRRQDPQPGPLLVQDLTEQARYRRTMTAAPRPTALDMLARLTQGGLVQVPAAPPTAVVYTSRMRRVFDRWIFGDAPVRVAEVEPLYRARCDSRRPASW